MQLKFIHKQNSFLQISKINSIFATNKVLRIMLNYPLSIQSFEKLRQGDFVYVDKTDYVYKLAHQGCTYFLARPRRFGKSLLCNTLRAYFEGKKELFEGLKFSQLEMDWIKYPILYLDFVSGDYTAGSWTLISKIKSALKDYEDNNGISFDLNLIKDKIAEIGEVKDDEIDTDLVPLLYYSGYLTIKEYIDEERLYILGFPNYEVEMSFFHSLARAFYGPSESANGLKYSKFLSDFRNADVESAIFRTLRTG